MSRSQEPLLSLAAVVLAGALQATAQTNSWVEFETSAYTVAENAKEAILDVRRAGDLSQAATVDYATLDGTAHAGQRYLSSSGRLSFAPGQTNRTINVSILDNPDVDGDATVGLALSNPSAGLMLGAETNATLTIQDNEHALGLDPNFGKHSQLNGEVTSVVVQPGRGMLIAGRFSALGDAQRDGVARLAADGTVDSTFDAGKLGITSPISLALQPDGKVLVAGADRLVRLEINGMPDKSFAPTGHVFAVVQPDGRILTARDSTLIRLNGDGSQDASFSPEFTFTDLPGAGSGVALQKDGRILAWGALQASNSTNQTSLLRLNADGTVDPTFTIGLGGDAPLIQALAVQQDGKILIGGWFDQVNGIARTNLARLNPDGSVDMTFELTRPFANGPPRISVLALQPDGEILMGGYFDSGLMRLNPQGTLDASLGTAYLGYVFEGLGRISAIAVQPDLGIVIGGNFWSVNDEPIRSLAKIIGDPKLRNVQFAANIFTVAEDDQQALITLVRGGNSGDSLTVDFATVDDTALSSRDYLSVHQTVTFAPLETEKTVPVSVLDNGRVDGSRRVGLSLTNPTPGVLWGTNRQARLTILDNEIPNLLDTSFDLGSGTDGYVYTLALQSDGKAIVAGTFSHVSGISHTNIARLHPDGSLDENFNAQTDSPVMALAVQPDGKILLAGLFSTINGVARSHVARLNADGSLDTTFKAPTSSAIWALSLALQPDGKVVVGGTGPMASGNGRRGIARLNANGSLDTSFDPGTGVTDSTGNSGQVQALLVQPDGKVLLTGSFSSINHVSVSGVARLNPDGSLDASFAGSGVSTDGSSFLVRQPDGKLLLGGSSPPLIRLNADGSLDESFAPDFGPDTYQGITSVALDVHGTIFFGGYFSSSNGVGLQGVGRIASDGTIDTTFRPEFGAGVSALAFQPDGKLLVAGSFTRVGPVTRNSVARLYVAGEGPPTFAFSESQLTASESSGAITLTIQRLGDTSIASTIEYQTSSTNASPGADYIPLKGTLEFAPLETSQTLTLPVLHNSALSADKTVALSLSGPTGGAVLFPGATNLLVRIADSERPGSVDLSFDPGTVAQGNDYGNRPGVYTMLVQPDGKILAGGVMARSVVRFETNGGLDTSFAGPSGSTVTTLQVQTDGKLLVGGYGLPTRLNPDGSVDTSFALDFQAAQIFQASALAVQPDGKILMAGQLPGSFSFLRNTVARLNPDGSRDPSFTTQILNVDTSRNQHSTRISSMVLTADGKVLIGGAFNNVNGHSCHRIARLNLDGSLDTNFVASVTLSSEFLEEGLTTLVLQPDEKILVAGTFTTVNGARRDGLARLNADGSLDPAFVPDLIISLQNPNGQADVVSALALQPDGQLIVGGSFKLATNRQPAQIVRLGSDGKLDPSFDVGEGVAYLEGNNVFPGVIDALALSPDGQVYVGGSFTSMDGFVRFGIVRLNGHPPVEITSIRRDKAGQTSLCIRSPAGRTLTLESSTNLRDWITVESITSTADNPEWTLPSAPSLEFLFYRLR